METNTINTTPDSKCSVEGDTRLVVCHIIAPLCEAHLDSALVLQAIVLGRLQASQVIYRHPLPMVAAVCAILVVDVPDLRAATEALRPLVQELDPALTGLAYYKPDSLRYHTLVGFALAHDRVLTPEKLAAAHDELHKAIAISEKLCGSVIDELRERKNQTNGSVEEDDDANPS